MFSIYGISGQLFRGSMEQLRQIGAVAAIDRSNAMQGVGRDGIEPNFKAFVAAELQEPSNEAHRNALATYAETQNVVMPRQPLTQVNALMSRTVITIPHTSTVLQAWKILASHSVGQAPVVNESLTLVGLLCRADLLRPETLPTPDSSALAWRALLAQSVAEVMLTPVPSVSLDTDIRRVAQVLLDRNLPGLPVVDELGVVNGFVSRSDILRAVVTDPPLDLWG